MMPVRCGANLATAVDQSQRIITTLFIALLLTGCVAAPTVPISALNYPSDSNARQRNLLVLLRGMGSDNTIFEKEGVISEIRKRHLPFDVIAPDAHFGYYQAKTIEIRLKVAVPEIQTRQL